MIITKVTLVAIISLIYMIGLAIVYFYKERPKTKVIKYYSTMIIVNIIGLIIHILVEYSVMYFPPLINSIVLKSILYYYIIFADIFICYSLFALKIKNANKLVVVQHLFSAIFIIFSTILPEHLYTDYDKLIFYTNGLDTKVVYLVSALVIGALLIMYFVKRNEMKRKDKISIFSFIIGMALTGLLQNKVPDLTIAIYAESIVCCMMYFTIENPDVEVGVYNAAKTQALKAGRAKEDFLSSMSHELRTPLNAIVGLSEIIEQESNQDEVKDDAKDITIASQDLLELVNSILNVNSIENNTLDLEESNYDLNKINQELIKMMDTRLYGKEVNLITNFSNDIPTTLYGDGYKLRTIITNLLSNAIKYTDRGIIEFNVSCINKGDICKLEITVKDTGRGISKEQQEHLFTKFNRREEDKDSDIKGVGLGLAITKSLVDLMEGSIKVESEENVGTRFTVKINQKIVELNKEEPKVEENNVEVL